MINQGFPLWAVEPDGAAYAVVGWDERGHPHLVPLQPGGGGAFVPEDSRIWRFTTTDPSERMESDAAPDDLRERLTALADRLVEQDMDTYVAGQIRAELDR